MECWFSQLSVDMAKLWRELGNGKSMNGYRRRYCYMATLRMVHNPMSPIQPQVDNTRIFHYTPRVYHLEPVMRAVQCLRSLSPNPAHTTAKSQHYLCQKKPTRARGSIHPRTFQARLAAGMPADSKTNHGHPSEVKLPLASPSIKPIFMFPLYPGYPLWPN